MGITQDICIPIAQHQIPALLKPYMPYCIVRFLFKL